VWYLTNCYVKGVPGTIAGLIGGTAAAWLAGAPVETITARFGGVPSGLPAFAIPAFQPALVFTLLSPALTVAMLGAIESLMSAVVADRMSGDRHNPNVELMAQGVANLVSPMFGGLPAKGAIARTATSIRSGARTPVAGMLHALTLLAILLVGAPLAGHIPMAVLAALLFIVAANMGEWHEIPAILRHPRTDIAVWAVTFGLTVLADLTVAVEVGMILAALLFVRRVSKTTTVTRVTQDYLEEGRGHVLQDKHIPDFVTIVRIHGPFLFGATDQLQARARRDGRYDHGRHLSPPEHDRDRRHWAQGARGRGQPPAADRPRRGLLRRTRTAPHRDASGRLCGRGRAGERLSEHRRGPGPGSATGPRAAPEYFTKCVKFHGPVADDRR
jgi:SulP family sulfate permease